MAAGEAQSEPVVWSQVFISHHLSPRRIAKGSRDWTSLCFGVYDWMTADQSFDLMYCRLEASAVCRKLACVSECRLADTQLFSAYFVHKSANLLANLAGNG